MGRRLSEAEYERLMQRARATNRQRDRDEIAMDLATPYDGPLSEQLRTVVSAFEAGIRTSDWDCVAEGLAMLEVIESKLRVYDNLKRG